MPPDKEVASLLEQLSADRASDPLGLLEELAREADLTQPKYRHVRAAALQLMIGKLARALSLSDFRNDVVLRPEGAFIDVGGLLMNVSRTPVYLKASREPYRNQGQAIQATLARMGIEPSTIVDVGANFGEISLSLARAYPAARVIAVEPSSDNAAILEINKAAQSFATDRIEIVREAVCERSGTVELMKGVSTMNQVVRGALEVPTERVPCDRLDGLFDRYGVASADFVKIDIEGGEPALEGAIAALGSRVRSYFIEFSNMAPPDDYFALAGTLLDRGFACYDEAGATRLAGPKDVERHLCEVLAGDSIAVTNLWFFEMARHSGEGRYPLPPQGGR